MELRFLELTMLKKHLRIENNITDSELTLYAASAEQEALNFMGRTLDSIYEEYGQMPADIILACTAHVGTAYKYREEITESKLYKLPYTWEAKLLPYRKEL